MKGLAAAAILGSVSALGLGASAQACGAGHGAADVSAVSAHVVYASAALIKIENRSLSLRSLTESVGQGRPCVCDHTAV